MKERPIPFQGAMVRALLAGTKTQTRRAVKYPAADGERGWHPIPTGFQYLPGGSARPVCPYGRPGDRLWVREAWRSTGDDGRCDDMPPRDLQPHAVWYEAAGVAPAAECVGKYRPPMFMPRWASRILLEVTEVRVQRLQEISEEDAQAEGCPCYVCDRTMDGLREGDCHCFHRKASASDYRYLWESINGAGSWDANCWVWAVSFKRVQP